MRARTKRWLARAGGSFGTGAVFVVALGAGAVLHIDTDAGRRAVARVVSGELGRTFHGKFTIDQIRHISWGFVEISHATVDTEDGKRVLEVSDASARFDIERLVRSIADGGAIDLEVSDLRVGAGDLTLDRDADGRLTIASAFTKRTPPADPTKPKPHVDIALATIQTVRVHGDVARDLDVHADGVEGHVMVDQAVTLDLTRARGRLDGPRVGSGALTATISGTARMPITAMGTTTAHADMDATLGAIKAHATATLADGAIAVHADAPLAPPEAWNAAFPGLTLTAPADATIEARATTDAAIVLATAHVGASTARVRAFAKHDDAWTVHANVVATQVDARAVAAAAPKTEIDAVATADGAVTTDGQFHAIYTLNTAKKGTLDGASVPPIASAGEIDNAHATAEVTASEPGIPTRASLTLAPLGPSGKLTFVADARAQDIGAITRVKIPAHGDARVHATGSMDLSTRTISATATADVKNLEAGSARAETVHAIANVRGPVGAPQIDVTADASEPEVGSARFSEARAKAKVTLGTTAVIEDAHVEARRGREHVAAHVDRATFGPGGATASGVAILGLGAPFRADVSRVNGETRVEAHAREIEIAPLLRLAGIENPGGRPKARFEASLRMNKSGVFGSARAELENAEIRGLPVTARATLDGEGKDVVVDATAEVTGVGKMDLARIHAQASADAPGDRAETWKLARYETDARATIDLAAAMGALLTDDQKKTMPRATGAVEITARAEGAEGSLFSLLNATATTSGLLVQTDTRKLAGIDASVSCAVDDDGDVEASIAAWDKAGALLHADAKTLTPWWTWLADPKGIVRDLSTAPIEARASVPERAIATFPLVPAGVTGEASGTATLTGTLRAPSVALDVNASQKDQRSSLRARYDGRAITAELDALEGQREVARILGHASVSAERLLDDGGDPDWTAGGSIDVKNLDLAKVPGAPRGLSGTANGHVALDGLHGDASLDGQVSVTKLAVSGVKLASVDVNAKVANGVANGAFDANDGKGTARVSGTAYVIWGGELVPRVDPTRGIRALYALDSFHIATLKPLVRKRVPELDGTITGTGSYDSTSAGAQIAGGLQIQNGLVYVTVLGEEVSNVSADVKLATGRITIDRVSGRMGSGDFVGAGWIAMKGLAFDSAGASVRVDDKARVPVSVEGATLAAASGEAEITVVAKTDSIESVVTMPHLHVELPSLSARSLQSLDNDPKVATGVSLGGRFDPIALARTQAADDEPARPFKITAKLGDDVYITQGTTMRIALHGQPTATIAADTQLAGNVTLGTGYLEVQGRRFIVDHGTISWDATAAPQNPTVVATAYWDAPEGTRVFASFVGPVKTGKMSLSSDPSYSQSEILSLLLIGSPDGTAGTNTADGSAAQGAATAVGGSVVTQGLNTALSGLSNVDVETSIDTTDNSSPRPRLTVRLANDITLDLAYIVGTPTPKDPDTTLGTVGWHFSRDWTVSTTYGDTGTTLFDLMWQYRY